MVTNEQNALCPIGLICNFMSIVNSKCENEYQCSMWTRPWQIPEIIRLEGLPSPLYLFDWTIPGYPYYSDPYGEYVRVPWWEILSWYAKPHNPHSDWERAHFKMKERYIEVYCKKDDFEGLANIDRKWHDAFIDVLIYDPRWAYPDGTGTKSLLLD